MNVERSTVGTKKSRQPKRQKSLNLIQSPQSLTTVRQEVQRLPYYFYGYWELPNNRVANANGLPGVTLVLVIWPIFT